MRYPSAESWRSDVERVLERRRSVDRRRVEFERRELLAARRGDAANAPGVWRVQTQHANLSGLWTDKLQPHGKRPDMARSLARAIPLPSRSFTPVGARTSCSSEITRARPFPRDWETSD